MKTSVGVEKGLRKRKLVGWEYRSEEEFPASARLSPRAAATAPGNDLRKRTSRLMFCAVAARKNCSRTNFNFYKRRRRESELILEFREELLPPFSFPEARWQRSESELVHEYVAGPVHGCGWRDTCTGRSALRPLRTRSATFAASEVGMGSIPDTLTPGLCTDSWLTQIPPAESGCRGSPEW